MDCHQITKVPVALEIMETADNKRLQQLFNCIYALFQSPFLNWIERKYSNGHYNEKLWEDAKDAFQNGLLALYRKAQNKELHIRGSLKTTVYSFGLLQLLAFFKKEKFVLRSGSSSGVVDRLLDNDLLEHERLAFLNEQENDLLDALKKLPKKQRDILVMKFFEKLKSKQIAERLHVTAGNVDNDAAKAYKKLRSLLSSKINFQKETLWS